MKSRAVALTERVIALVEAARAKTVAAVNLAMVYAYYEIGRQIDPSPIAANCQLLCKTRNRAKGNR